MNTNIQSIYIPRMCKTTTEDKICDIMYDYHIGSVSHIDFTCVNKKPGFIEDDGDEKFKSAFIHLNKPLSLEHLHEEYTMFWNKIERGETCKLFVGRNDAISTHTHEYWMCFKNKNPVPRTQMNIHQVVEAGKHLEKAHNEKIEELEKKLEGVQNVVYQLLAGLFHQSEQVEVLSTHSALVWNGGMPDTSKWGEDTHKWNSWPTTRQGDDCEHRLDELEKKIADKNVNKNENTNILEKLERKLYTDYLKHQKDITTYQENIKHFKAKEWYEEKELEEEKVCNSREFIRQIQETYEEVSGQKFETLIEKFKNKKA